MYPLKGELQDLGKHRGVTVEMRGYGEVMEGVSRRELLHFQYTLQLMSRIAQFFKGVATICTKLFNAVEVGFGIILVEMG
jgi:pantoate--beta-alanine ligase